MNTKIAITAGACLLGLAAVPASAATQIVSNGILTGATGVLVGGISYDVSFARGTCAQAFGSCEQSKFAFSTQQDAARAAQALLDQIIIDGANGNFDSDTTKTAFCTSTFVCSSRVVYSVDSIYYNSVGANNYARFSNSVDPFGVRAEKTLDNTGDGINFAVFAISPVIPAVSGAVPEPATWAMMMFGFGGMGYTMRRKAKVGTRVRFA